MKKTDKKTLQTMAVIVGAIMVGVVVQHSGTDDVQNFAIEKTRISSQLEQIVETTFPEHTLETVSKDSELESTPEIIVIESNSFGKAFAEARENIIIFLCGMVKLIQRDWPMSPNQLTMKCR